jgi:hypothetical protein
MAEPVALKYRAFISYTSWGPEEVARRADGDSHFSGSTWNPN